MDRTRARAIVNQMREAVIAAQCDDRPLSFTFAEFGDYMTAMTAANLMFESYFYVASGQAADPSTFKLYGASFRYSGRKVDQMEPGAIVWLTDDVLTIENVP